MKINTYQKRKETAREKAIIWQLLTSSGGQSYFELATAEAYFEKLGKRFGLLKEFKENGIL